MCFCSVCTHKYLYPGGAIFIDTVQQMLLAYIELNWALPSSENTHDGTSRRKCLRVSVGVYERCVYAVGSLLATVLDNAFATFLIFHTKWTIHITHNGICV